MIDAANVVLILIAGLIYTLFVHFLADFVFQSTTMATYKSSSNKFLTTHILAYVGVLLVCFSPFILFTPVGTTIFLAIMFNGMLHWVIDYFTSRAAKKAWLKDDRHNFFVIIGFDQFLHVTFLILSFFYVALT